MELRQLEYFLSVARLGKVTRAAAALFVSQPSVTVSVRKLESELGVELFDRSSGRLALTAEGRRFMERAERILMQVEDAAAEMRDSDGPIRGALRIGITPMLGALLLPPALARFRKDAPEVEISLVEEGSLAIGHHLEKGELDLGIMVISDLSASLSSRGIGEGRIVACIPPGHPLAALEAIPFPALRDQPLILFQGDTYTRKVILAECARSGFSPNIAFASSQVGTAMGLVAQGVGIAFFIEELARGRTDVELRPLAVPILLATGLAWNRGRYLSRAAKAFVDAYESSRESGGLPGRGKA